MSPLLAMAGAAGVLAIIERSSSRKADPEAVADAREIHDALCMIDHKDPLCVCSKEPWSAACPIEALPEGSAVRWMREKTEDIKDNPVINAGADLVDELVFGLPKKAAGLFVDLLGLNALGEKAQSIVFVVIAGAIVYWTVVR